MLENHMDGSPRLLSGHGGSAGPLLFHFAEFAQKRGCTEIASTVAFVEEFVRLWLTQSQRTLHLFDFCPAEAKIRVRSGWPTTRSELAAHAGQRLDVCKAHPDL